MDKSVKWSSRKLWLAMFWQAVQTVLLVLGYLPVPAYEALTWLLLGGYFLTNVSAKVIEKRSERLRGGSNVSQML